MSNLERFWLMIRKSISIITAVMLSACIYAAEADVSTAFDKDCESFVLKRIDEAKVSIDVAIFSFTRHNISRALVRAVKRGVKLSVKYDKSQAQEENMKEVIEFLGRNGVSCEPVSYADDKTRMHHKFMVIDDKRVITGSYNFTSQASESNAENVLCIESREIAAEYHKEYDAIKSEKKEKNK
jgi:phosphatidylserine/phosphatidylglycerophosphate/cardiolipin synthase-like enzyme